MNKQFKIVPPRMPNYAQIDGLASTSIDIGTFDKEEAEQYAKLMHDTFLEHWKQRKNQQEGNNLTGSITVETEGHRVLKNC